MSIEKQKLEAINELMEKTISETLADLSLGLTADTALAVHKTNAVCQEVQRIIHGSALPAWCQGISYADYLHLLESAITSRESAQRQAAHIIESREKGLSYCHSCYHILRSMGLEVTEK